VRHESYDTGSKEVAGGGLIARLEVVEAEHERTPRRLCLPISSRAKTFAIVTEWLGNERLCCPFFEFDMHVGDNTEPMTLQTTGTEGVKQFIQAEL